MLLGKDIAHTLNEKVYTALIEILTEYTLKLLAYDMSKYENLYRESDDEKVDWCEELFKP